MLGLPDGVTACLFDLDGVLTDTAKGPSGPLSGGQGPSGPLSGGQGPSGPLSGLAG